MNDPMKWQFPEVSLAPGGYLVVFASGKDRRDPAGQLHTNFALQTGGESVALVEPDGRTIVSAYRDYPPQLADISYGVERQRRLRESRQFYCRRGPMPRRWFPASRSASIGRKPGFNDAAWLAGKTGVGYDYAGLVGLDVAAMYGVNKTVYIRIPFAVADVAAIDKLILRMRYEDGFVAYLNGIEVARANAPAGRN